mmetsp:Transcript_25342/g.61032  ORF Transcript_25342/g.61032 Transcript_25342/m.61032 type:complete len:157 (+) Transcript_25342:75-545(+)
MSDTNTAKETKAAGTEKPKLRKPNFTTIEALEPLSRTVNLVCRVADMQVVMDTKRVDGSTVKIAEATIADKTGCMILTCRTEEQFKLCTKGADLIVRNAHVRMHRGHMRLGVDKWGLIEVYDEKWGYSKPPTEEEMNLNNNISNVEYEEVVDDQRK